MVPKNNISEYKDYLSAFTNVTRPCNLIIMLEEDTVSDPNGLHRRDGNLRGKKEHEKLKYGISETATLRLWPIK
jgi:hypothetical protein